MMYDLFKNNVVLHLTQLLPECRYTSFKENDLPAILVQIDHQVNPLKSRYVKNITARTFLYRHK